MPFDALLLVSFGGPEKPEDVIPFLENVLRGKNVPRERMLAVAEHYYHFGGKSPINEQNRQLIAALQKEFAGQKINLPIYWGNRNWQPLLADTLREMKNDGVKNALAFFTSAFSSYSGCRQYRENIAAAQAEVGEGVPQISKLRSFYNHPDFIGAMADQIQKALWELPAHLREDAQVAYTAHSIPLSMARGSKYVEQLEEACRLVSEQLGRSGDHLVYQSRSGPPTQPWLEPDVLEYLRLAHANGTRAVVLAPIGFISDHMEVLYDLDTEAKNFCEQIQLPMARAATVGTHPLFVRMICELVTERLNPDLPRRALGNLGPNHEICPENCCLSGVMRPPLTSAS
ncbi:MAG: ferrochelatase [Terriglobales bacterium]|jgi:ferrochelatase